MTAAPPVCVLWDASHIWGLMAWRAVRALGLSCRLVKGKEIAEGGPLGKPGEGGPALLLVPGGTARLKAQALGAAGREAVRRWVAEGGGYLGFCGGAGLALSHAAPDNGLGLCPWRRAGYPQRLHHLISGHVLARAAQGLEFSPPADAAADASGASPHGPPPGLLALPVWWPGRFSPGGADGVDVLAACHSPGADFWLADLPLRSLPDNVFPRWRALYGVNLSTDFLDGQPLAVSGRYGKGSYVLSYSHLETPRSPGANRWLAAILRRMTGRAPARRVVPAWRLRHPQCHWPREAGAPLLTALDHMRSLLDLAVGQHLLFARTHWLWGWRAGLPGAACNNLHAALCVAAGLEPGPRTLAFWREARARFVALEELFTAGAEDYFLTRRLADTLAPTLPDAVDRRWLDHQCQAIFGHPMGGGGILADLLEILEELVYLSQ